MNCSYLETKGKVTRQPYQEEDISRRVWALLYDSGFQDFLRKLQTRWLDPYEFQEVDNNGTLILTTIDGFGHSLKMNGHRVSLYHKWIIKETFCEWVCEDPSMQILCLGSHDPTSFLSKN